MHKIIPQNKTYYDHESKVYDENRYGSEKGKRVARFHENVLSRLLLPELNASSEVLEFGCGTGRLLDYVSVHCKTLAGVDISEGMLTVAKERLSKSGKDVDLRQVEPGELPFDSAQFDAVYSILVINLIPDFEETFKIISKVLKPGGVFVFNVPNIKSIYFLGGLYVNLRGKTVGSNQTGHRYSHWFWPGEWRKALREAGFEVEQVLGQPPNVRKVDGAEPLNGNGVGGLLSKSLYIKARLVNGE